ncbi:MAG: hypothetical protein IPK82_23640 [Polyangiaceae bacterium]|nr:hypothetical protein [Polyangiaceae bacterium]
MCLRSWLIWWLICGIGACLSGFIRQFVGRACGDWGRWDWYALRDLVGLLFLYESGARVGELCGLGVAALGRVEGVDGGAAVAVMVYGKERSEAAVGGVEVVAVG